MLDEEGEAVLLPHLHLDLKNAKPGVLLALFLKKGSAEFQQKDLEQHKNSEPICLFPLMTL